MLGRKMGNKITRVVVEGSQGDINSAVSPISFFAIFFNILPSLVRIERGTKYTLFMSVTTQKNALFLISFLLKVFSVGLHTLDEQKARPRSSHNECNFLKIQRENTDYAPFWEVDAYLRLFMFKPIEFPGFLCKARFPPGGKFFIHLKCSPHSQTILNKRKS